MSRIELRNRLDQERLAEILTLIGETSRIEGHSPLGEHKASHLAVGARDLVGILAYEDEMLVGYVHAQWNAEGRVGPPVPRMAAEVVVHPDRRDTDVPRRLLDETRSLLGRAGGGLLYLWVHWVEDARTTLAARMGFRIQRELAFMARDLDGPPEVVLPSGVVVRPYREGVDDEAFLAVNNAAFSGHPENGRWSAMDLAQRRTLAWFDPDGLLMAWRGEELLGFHWTKWHGHDMEDHPPHGEVYVLAVAPSAQGIGLGRALLHAGLAHLAGRGCRRVVLYVDGANESACGLYASEGFVTRSMEVCYADEVWPVIDHQIAELLPAARALP